MSLLPVMFCPVSSLVENKSLETRVHQTNVKLFFKVRVDWWAGKKQVHRGWQIKSMDQNNFYKPHSSF